MDAILEYLQNIGDAIISLIDFIGQFMVGTISMIETFIELIPALPSFFTWLPASVWASISIVLGLALFYRILGWGD